MTVPPHLWGRLMAGLDDRTFARRLAQESDPERIRAALKREDERQYETRVERIRKLNKRLNKLK